MINGIENNKSYTPLIEKHKGKLANTRLKALTPILVSVILITGCVEESLKAPESLKDKAIFENVGVSLGKNNITEYLIKTDPKSDKYWYEIKPKVNNIPWNKNHSCLDFALEAAMKWKQDSGNDGLYIADSKTHAFNAIYTGGDALEIANWTFFEPQNGKIIAQIGLDRNFDYSFPINVNLRYVGYSGQGISPLEKIIWETKNTKGTLYDEDEAGNLIPK